MWVRVISAMLRRARLLAGKSAELPKSLLISGGGSATTSLLAAVSREAWNCPFDTDGLKHLPRPILLLKRRPSTRLVFISREPSAVIESLHRRGYCRPQSMKLGLSAWDFFRSVLAPHQSLHAHLAAQLQNQREWFESCASWNPNVQVHTYESVVNRVRDNPPPFLSSKEFEIFLSLSLEASLRRPPHE